jgi:hypothetical protein
MRNDFILNRVRDELLNGTLPQVVIDWVYGFTFDRVYANRVVMQEWTRLQVARSGRKKN